MNIGPRIHEVILNKDNKKIWSRVINGIQFDFCADPKKQTIRVGNSVELIHIFGGKR